MIEPFDPDIDNWATYIEQLDQYFLANKVPDETKVAVFSSAIEKKDYSILRNMLQLEKPSTCTNLQRVDSDYENPTVS